MGVQLLDGSSAAIGVNGNPLVVAPSLKTLAGIYYYHSGRFTVLASAQNGTSTAILWVFNPNGSKSVRVRRACFQFSPIDTTAFTSAPRVAMARFTYTGTQDGTGAITPAKRKSADSSAVGVVATSASGATVSLVATGRAFLVGPTLTGVGVAVPSLQEWAPIEEEMPVLAQNEGVVFYQIDNGTSSDTRIAIVDVVTEEYT